MGRNNIPPDPGSLVRTWTDMAMQMQGLLDTAEDNLPELDGVLDDDQREETLAAIRGARTAVQAALGAYTVEYQRQAAHQQMTGRFGNGRQTQAQPTGYTGGGRATVNAPVPGRPAQAPAPEPVNPHYSPQPQPAQQW